MSPNQDFVVIFKKGSQKPILVISKKVAKRAVDRNRIKRLFKESMRSLNLTNHNLTIIVKKNLADLKKNQIQERLEKLLKSDNF